MAVPVAAEKIFMAGALPVTNSLMHGWLIAAIFVIVAALLRKPRQRPSGLQNAAEALLEFMLNFMDQVTNDREKSKKFLPIAGTMFLFIAVSNWTGLIPGVGTIGRWLLVHGERELVPLIRPSTSDLNMTLAMGVSAVVLSHVFGVMAIGFFKYWNKFIQIGSLVKAAAALGRVPFGTWAVGLFTACVECVVGLIELVSEAAKMVSLSLRLFGNIFAGEMLLYVISSLMAYAMPLPFIFMEIIVGFVQALVFSTLTLVYLTLATSAPHGAEPHEQEAAHPA